VRRSKYCCLGQGSETDLAWVAQLVERVLGKDEVTGSIPVPGSRISERRGVQADNRRVLLGTFAKRRAGVTQR
jgi:hypothetical protein